MVHVSKDMSMLFGVKTVFIRSGYIQADKRQSLLKGYLPPTIISLEGCLLPSGYHPCSGKPHNGKFKHKCLGFGSAVPHEKELQLIWGQLG